ncbi:hypothetical protein F4678DRAFT_478903 [Xylaria arbuscula]|nr:hypothetical protein F4678DRAFT_478903 [Xylaria arbuscula]
MAMDRLQNHRFTLENINKGHDTLAFVQRVIKDAKRCDQSNINQLKAAFEALDGNIQSQIDVPSKDTTIDSFISAIRDREGVLKKLANERYTWPRPQSSNTYPNPFSRSRYPQSRTNGPQYIPQNNRGRENNPGYGRGFSPYTQYSPGRQYQLQGPYQARSRPNQYPQPYRQQWQNTTQSTTPTQWPGPVPQPLNQAQSPVLNIYHMEEGFRLLHPRAQPGNKTKLPKRPAMVTTIPPQSHKRDGLMATNPTSSSKEKSLQIGPLARETSAKSLTSQPQNLKIQTTQQKSLYKLHKPTLIHQLSQQRIADLHQFAIRVSGISFTNPRTQKHVGSAE